MIAIVAVAALIWSFHGIAAILLLAGGVGLLLLHPKRSVAAVRVLTALLSILGLPRGLRQPPLRRCLKNPALPNIADVWRVLFQGWSADLGGGCPLIAFIHGQVVNQFSLADPKSSLMGSRSPTTPGPILMVAAYVGLQSRGACGPAFRRRGIFLPAFMMMWR